MTRLARNCSDWYPLLDLCGFKGCLIADRDGVYEPASPNGRLRLGLKGQISEMELHTIRARLTAVLFNKAEHDLMWRIWDVEGGRASDQEVKARTLAEPSVRRAIVPIIQHARDKDAEAADHIERALAR